MKLNAEITGDKHAVDLRLDGSRVFAEIDGRSYELEMYELGAGDFLVISNGRVFDCRVEGRPESGKSVEVFVGTSHFAVALTDPKRLRGFAGSIAHADQAARIVAPMPGKVVRILVDVGTEIEAGAGVIVVEAMKMQNEMKSPIAGTVRAMSVEVGATVNAGDVLAVIE